MEIKKTCISIISILLLFSFNLSAQDKFQYPPATQSNQSDIIWGKEVKDPYRWMENTTSPEVQQWLDAEEKITKECSGTIFTIKQDIGYYSEIDFKPLYRQGNYYFSYEYFVNNESPELFYQRRIGSDDPDLLFDPNKLDKSANTSIRGFTLSEDNKTLALVLAKNGGDWQTIRFLDMKTQKLLRDTIDFVKYSDIYWYKNMIFYCRFNVKNTKESFEGLIKGMALYCHRLGTNQNEDILVYKPESDYSDIEFSVSVKNNYIIVHHAIFNSGKKYFAVAISNLSDSLKFQFNDFLITPKVDIYYHVIGMLNGKLLVQTNFSAPNGVINKYDPKGVNKGERFIPEYSQQLDFSVMMCNKIISVYKNDSMTIVGIQDTNGLKITQFAIPDCSSFSRFSGDENDSILIVGFNSFFNPPSMYQVNVNTGKLSNLSKTYVNYDNMDATTRRVYYHSKDGTLIPMYLTYKKGIKPNGKNPTLLYGYGGFGVRMEPFFDAANVAFIKRGGILATPCIRGGGDFPGWHEKGMRLNKQNTFDDFIAAAEYLISKKYTNPEKLAAMGASNGGMLVGAVMIQRPDLFKVVIGESGLYDMMRYHLYNVGYVYDDEIGNVKDSADFRNLISYSPYHNVKSTVNYPATLLVSSDNDDRVNPFHTFKFLAALQSNNQATNPYVLYYQKKAGHLGSDNIKNDANREAYIYAFIIKYLGM